MEQERRRAERYRALLEQIAYGTPLDSSGNRDDDGLLSMTMGLSGPSDRTMHEWLNLIESELNGE